MTLKEGYVQNMIYKYNFIVNLDTTKSQNMESFIYIFIFGIPCVYIYEGFRIILHFLFLFQGFEHNMSINGRIPVYVLHT